MQNTPVDWDVVVVGGGPAGASTASMLAKRGRRVLVLERERFPRYHIGESLITGMLSVIEMLDLRERLHALGFERKYGISMVWGKEHGLWNLKFKLAGPYEYSYHVDRGEFDELLLTRAGELGATVLQEAVFRESIVEDDRVVGVRYTHEGQTHEARARLVVDASGQARAVARRFSDVKWHPDLKNLAVWGYFDNVNTLPEDQHGHILVERNKDQSGWFWGIPLAGNRLSAGFVAPIEDVKIERNDLAGFFSERLKETEQMQQLLGDGSKQVGEFRTARDWSYMSEDYVGNGWVTIGDASCFVDPLLSSGVCLGLLCSVPLAQGIDILLDDPSREKDLLQRYADGCRAFHQSLTDYVMFFYDQERDREDYLERATAIGNNPLFTDPKSGFVGLISGISGMGPIFNMYEDEDEDKATAAP